MARWRCYSQWVPERPFWVESVETPSNDTQWCVLEEGDPDAAAYVPKVRMPPEPPPPEVSQREFSLSSALGPVFRIDPVGPIPEDPYTDPSMAEVNNPPSSPRTNLLKGPWAGQLNVSGNTGVDPKLSFRFDELESGDTWFNRNRNWLWLLIVAAMVYAWSRDR